MGKKHKKQTNRGSPELEKLRKQDKTWNIRENLETWEGHRRVTGERKRDDKGRGKTHTIYTDRR